MEEISVSWFVLTVSSICNGIKNRIMSMDDLKYFYMWERIQVRVCVKSSLQFWRKLKGKGRRRWSRRGRMVWGVLIVYCAVTSVCIAVSCFSLQFCERCCHKKQTFCLKTCFVLSLSQQVFDFTKNCPYTDHIVPDQFQFNLDKFSEPVYQMSR